MFPLMTIAATKGAGPVTASVGLWGMAVCADVLLKHLLALSVSIQVIALDPGALVS